MSPQSLRVIQVVVASETVGRSLATGTRAQFKRKPHASQHQPPDLLSHGQDSCKGEYIGCLLKGY